MTKIKLAGSAAITRKRAKLPPQLVYTGPNDYSKPYCRHGVDYVHDCDLCMKEDEDNA